jgi:hypothetical protein
MSCEFRATLRPVGKFRVTLAQAFPVSGGGAVSSVFTRTGDVVAQTGDYTAAQVTDAVSELGTYPDPAWIPSYAYGKLTGTPATFPPAAHVHDAADVASGVLDPARVPALPYAPTVHTHGGADITSGVVAPARLGTGTADATVYLRGDGTWAAPAFAPLVPAINAQTGTAYTLTAGDNGKIVTLNNAAAITLTVPAGLGAGFSVLLIQLGAGKVTVTASGVTIVQRQSFLKTAGQYAVASVLAYAANVFVLSGDVAA